MSLVLGWWPALRIAWREGDDHVLMTGPVEFEYEGKFDPALFAKQGAA